MKKEKVKLKFRQTFRMTLILGTAASVLLSGLIALDVFDRIELKLLNIGFKKRAPIVKKDDIVTIDIDDYAITQIGRWPWSWDLHASLLDFLSMYKARRVALVDMDFSKEVPINFAEDSVGDIKKTLFEAARSSKGSGGTASVLPDFSRTFYDSVLRNGNTCFSVNFKIFEDRLGRQKSLQLAERNAGMHSAAKREGIGLLRSKAGFSGKPGYFPIATDIIPPTGDILKDSGCFGFNNILIDRDGVVRRYPLISYYRGYLYPSIGLRVAGQLMGGADIKVEGGKYVELRGKKESLRIPINDRGEMYINWTGAFKESFVHVPFNLVTSFIGMQLAKDEFHRYPLETMSDPMALNRILVQKLKESRLFAEDQSSYIGTVVFVSGLIEYYMEKGNYTVEDVLGALGLDLRDRTWLDIGRQIYFNNRLVKKSRQAGKVPPFEELLKDAGFPVDRELEQQLRGAYDGMKYYIENGLVDRARPLYLDSPKKLSQGKKDVLITPLFFRNKVVFYGLTATGLTAQNATPFSDREPMLDMVPNVLNTIATRNFLDVWKYFISYAYLFAVLFCVLLLTPVQGFLFALLAAAAHLGLSWYAFTERAYVLPVSQPITAVFGSYLSAVAYRYFQEQKERKKVRGMFSTMVSPEVLKMMEENPDRFKLAGEKSEATMFSSDVSGFTTISEGVTARELANILNIYLTPMSNIIMSYNGYIDKYEGDAIKADFGVPMHDPDHAWKACFSALYQQEELKVIQRMIFLKYGVKVTARMGVNTGTVSAGNMGSEKRMQYTVMGAAATLAEELEPANKLFETWIAVGPSTFEQAEDYVEVRYLNELIMGAERHAVRVYELVGWNKERFLAYWLNKPVPGLALESLKKMLPEKVLAYHEFYERKELPESGLVTDLKNLFSGLREQAIEYMRTNNIKSVLYIMQELDSLKTGLKQHEDLYRDGKTPDNLLKDILALEQKTASENADWNRILLQWRKDLKECSSHLSLLKGKIAKEENDQYLNMIDVLEKSIECIYKRISFAAGDDRLASDMSGHLKELLLSGGSVLSSNDMASLTEKSGSLENEINSRLAAFAEALKNRADEYHNMMADFCIVSEAKKKVIGLFSEGHNYYLGREWDLATGKFMEALEIIPDDGPCMKFIRKIEELRNADLPEDWDGTWEE